MPSARQTVASGERLLAVLLLVRRRHSGYEVGGTCPPFGTRQVMPVYCEESIAALPRICMDGGKRGYIISLCTTSTLTLLKPRLVHAAR